LTKEKALTKKVSVYQLASKERAFLQKIARQILSADSQKEKTPVTVKEIRSTITISSHQKKYLTSGGKRKYPRKKGKPMTKKATLIPRGKENA